MGIGSMIGGASYGQLRSKLNTVTLLTAFVLSIMVIHNTRNCEDNKGYPPKHTFVNFGYGISIFIFVICCILFAMDIFFKVTKFSPI